MSTPALFSSSIALSAVSIARWYSFSTSPPLRRYRRIMMSPLSVNLIALFSVFSSTCCTRMASPMTLFGTPSSTWYPTLSFSLDECRPTISITVAITACGWKGSCRNTSLSASTREKSKISEMSACNVSPELRMVVT